MGHVGLCPQSTLRLIPTPRLGRTLVRGVTGAVRGLAGRGRTRAFGAGVVRIGGQVTRSSVRAPYRRDKQTPAPAPARAVGFVVPISSAMKQPRAHATRPPRRSTDPR